MPAFSKSREAISDIFKTVKQREGITSIRKCTDSCLSRLSQLFVVFKRVGQIVK